jgi:multicomponent Na+:H+ antiporter subunit A
MRFGLAAQYERSLEAIPRIAAASTRWLQHGRSPGYMALAAAVAVIALGLPLVVALPGVTWPEWSTPAPGFVGGALLIAAGALVAVAVRDRLVLLLGAGLVGYGSAVLFLFAGAPDVAFTQVVVETVFVIVVAAVLLTLRRRGRAMSVAEPAWRPLAFALALSLASVLTALLLAAAALPFDDTLSRWFGEQSVPAAQGRNVVNVILVDFRALDTLGEITVVMLSLLAALPLLGLHTRLRTQEAGR